MQRAQWMASLPEIRLSPKEQTSIAPARKEKGQTMTLTQFETDLLTVNKMDITWRGQACVGGQTQNVARPPEKRRNDEF